MTKPELRHSVSLAFRYSIFGFPWVFGYFVIGYFCDNSCLNLTPMGRRGLLPNLRFYLTTTPRQWQISGVRPGFSTDSVGTGKHKGAIVHEQFRN